jgi:hypothetical protein
MSRFTDWLRFPSEFSIITSNCDFVSGKAHFLLLILFKILAKILVKIRFIIKDIEFLIDFWPFFALSLLRNRRKVFPKDYNIPKEVNKAAYDENLLFFEVTFLSFLEDLSLLVLLNLILSKAIYIASYYLPISGISFFIFLFAFMMPPYLLILFLCFSGTVSLASFPPFSTRQL